MQGMKVIGCSHAGIHPPCLPTRTVVISKAVLQKAGLQSVTPEPLEAGANGIPVASTSGRLDDSRLHSLLQQQQQHRRRRAEADWQHYASKLNKSLTKHSKRLAGQERSRRKTGTVNVAKTPGSAREQVVNVIGEDTRQSQALLAALVLCQVANTQRRISGYDVSSPKSGRSCVLSTCNIMNQAQIAFCASCSWSADPVHSHAW